MGWISERIQTGDNEPITAVITDFAAPPQLITDLTNIKIFIKRTRDGLYLDWADNTFKGHSSLAQKLMTLTEADKTGDPGKYHLDTATHVKGLDTSAISGLVAGDVLHVTAIQDGSPQSAANVPQVGEIKVGGWVDYIDQAISDNATPAEVQDELRAIRLHQLVSVNPGAVQPGTGTYIKQILDKLNTVTGYMVEMNFSYHPGNDELTANVWVGSNNLIVAAPTSLTLELYNSIGVLQYSMTDSAPDAQGVFRTTRTPTGLLQNQAYYAKALVEISGVGTVEGIKGMFTIG